MLLLLEVAWVLLVLGMEPGRDLLTPALEEVCALSPEDVGKPPPPLAAVKPAARWRLVMGCSSSRNKSQRVKTAKALVLKDLTNEGRTKLIFTSRLFSPVTSQKGFASSAKSVTSRVGLCRILLRPTLHAIAHKYPRQWPVEQYFRPWWAVASFGRREVCLQPPPRWHPPAQQEPPSWPPPPLSLVIPAPRQPLPPLLHHRHRPRTTTYRPLPTSSKISPTARRHSNRTSADPSQLRRPASSSAAYRNRPSASRPSATAG